MKVVGITGDELRKALAEVERAEAAGFIASQAVFSLEQKNECWSDGTFDPVMGVSEKAHPTDRRLDWGRDNFLVNRGFRFVDGKLMSPKVEEPE